MTQTLVFGVNRVNTSPPNPPNFLFLLLIVENIHFVNIYQYIWDCAAEKLCSVRKIRSGNSCAGIKDLKKQKQKNRRTICIAKHESVD